MDSLSSVSPSIVLPPSNPLHHQRPRISLSSSFLKPTSRLHLSYSHDVYRRRTWSMQVYSMKLNGGKEEEENRRRNEEIEKALHMDGTISGSSSQFLEQVSSGAYHMRRHLQQSVDTSSYDVLEANPWRENSKPLYVLTHNENQLCTMKIRRPRSEVEGELGQLFSSKGGSKLKNQDKQSGDDSKFQMLVEDIREGVLVFEDENEAASYCDLLQGGGQDCEGVAEIEASWVFDLCQKARALAVLFRRGRTPPQPENLKLHLRARNRSLED